MADTVLISDTEGVRVLTLNRPERLNALDTATREAIAAALDAALAAEGVRAVVLTGTGDRAFCAGQDLNESASLTSEDGPRWMASWTAYFDALSRFTKPIVVAVNGVAAGAGFQTALLGDIRVAMPSASFGMAEVDVGLPAITGAHLLGLHLGQARAVDLVLTGRMLEAAEAERIGLVHEIAPAEALLARGIAIATELGAKPPVAMRLDLERFRSVVRPGLRAAEAAAVAYQSEAVASGEPQRIMAEFLASRAARHRAR